MALSINDFWRDVAVATGDHVDFRELCAKDVASLNENPTSRVNESSFFSNLQRAGVPGDVVTDLRRSWAPEFNRFRDFMKKKKTRTPPLKLFRICAESIAAQYNHSLERVLAKQWMEFAVKPEERARLDGLLERLETFRVDPVWTERLVGAWELLFAPGGHGDMSVGAPEAYYEIEEVVGFREVEKEIRGEKKIVEEPIRHLSFIHPFEADHPTSYVREYRKNELEQALALLEENPILIVLGHPGWRPWLGKMDLWVDTLKVKMPEGKLAILNLENRRLDPAKMRFPRRANRLVIMARTQWRTHKTAAEDLRPVLEALGAKGKVPVLAAHHKLMNEVQAGQMLYGERESRFNKADEAREEVDKIARDHPLIPFHVSRSSQKATPPTFLLNHGNWGNRLQRMLDVSKTNFVTIQGCTAPFFTFNLKMI